MTRSSWKPFFIDLNLIKKFDELLIFSYNKVCEDNNFSNLNKKQKYNLVFDTAKRLTSQFPVEVWSRKSIILPEFFGFTFNVHNGKIFKKIIVKKNMLFCKFGEFSITKKLGPNIHKDKPKGKKKKEPKKKRR